MTDEVICAHCHLEMEGAECEPCPVELCGAHNSCNRCWRTLVAEAKVRNAQDLVESWRAQVAHLRSRGFAGDDLARSASQLENAIKDITR